MLNSPSTLKSLTVALLGIALSSPFGAAQPAQAITLTYDFTIHTFDGGAPLTDPLTNQALGGSFSIDTESFEAFDSRNVYYDLKSFSFMLAGTTYTEASAFNLNRGVYDLDGEFKGLYIDDLMDFSNPRLHTPGFYILPSITLTGEQSVFYYSSDGIAQDRVGAVTYTLRSSNTEAVPEPFTLLGTGAALGVGTLFKHQRSRRQPVAKSS
jgi:hypothetical protein